MSKIELKSLKEIEVAANQFIQNMNDNKIFAFYGKMGSGKTTFIKAICKQLGSDDNITSPTFAIINEYTTQTDLLIYHFDFYRIKNLQEAFDLGYEEYFYSGNYCFIEWPEKIEELLPEDTVKVTINVDEHENRIIESSTI